MNQVESARYMAINFDANQCGQYKVFPAASELLALQRNIAVIRR